MKVGGVRMAGVVGIVNRHTGRSKVSLKHGTKGFFRLEDLKVVKLARTRPRNGWYNESSGELGMTPTAALEVTETIGGLWPRRQTKAEMDGGKGRRHPWTEDQQALFCDQLKAIDVTEEEAFDQLKWCWIEGINVKYNGGRKHYINRLHEIAWKRRINQALAENGGVSFTEDHANILAKTELGEKAMKWVNSILTIDALKLHKLAQERVVPSMRNFVLFYNPRYETRSLCRWHRQVFVAMLMADISDGGNRTQTRPNVGKKWGPGGIGAISSTEFRKL